MTHNVNTTTNTFRANIRVGTCAGSASLVLGPYVSPDETVSINLATGIRLAPGTQLCMAIGGAGGNEGFTATFTGYTNPTP